MSEPLRFMPPRVPFINVRTGLISREWYLFFQGIFDRVGGSTGASTTDLSLSMPDDAGTEETKMALFSLAIEALSAPLPQQPVQENQIEMVQQFHMTIEHLTTELCELREKVAVLENEITALQQLPV